MRSTTLIHSLSPLSNRINVKCQTPSLRLRPSELQSEMICVPFLFSALLQPHLYVLSRGRVFFVCLASFCFLLSFFVPFLRTAAGARCRRESLRAGGVVSTAGTNKTTQHVTLRPIPPPRFASDITDGSLMNHPILRREGHRGVATLRAEETAMAASGGSSFCPFFAAGHPSRVHLRTDLTGPPHPGCQRALGLGSARPGPAGGPGGPPHERRDSGPGEQ